jgi:peroxiredoxin
MARLNNLNAQVIGVSVNDPFSNKGFAEKNLLVFPLLRDYTREVIRLYGIELKDFAGLRDYSVAKRSVFEQDQNGIVRYKWVSEEPGIELNYKEIEEVLNQID